MLAIIPYEVRTVHQRSPWGNLASMVITVLMFIVTWYDAVSEDLFYNLMLEEGNWIGLPGHILLHAGWMHLIGNMVLLFVFGNAICGVMNSLLYVGVYTVLGLAAGVVHLVLDGNPAVGASGALCGIMGFYLAVYPLNRVNCVWIFLIQVGRFGMRGWVLILLWFAADLLGVIGGGDDIAHWAHIGGTVSGFFLGLLFLKLGKVDLYDYDNPTVLDLLPSRSAEDPKQAA